MRQNESTHATHCQRKYMLCLSCYSRTDQPVSDIFSIGMRGLHDCCETALAQGCDRYAEKHSEQNWHNPAEPAKAAYVWQDMADHFARISGMIRLHPAKYGASVTQSESL